MTMMIVFHVQRKFVKFTLKFVNGFEVDMDSDSSKPSMHVQLCYNQVATCFDGQTQILSRWTYSPLLIDLLIKLLSTFYQRGLVDLEGEWQVQCEILSSPSIFLDYIVHLIKMKILDRKSVV